MIYRTRFLVLSSLWVVVVAAALLAGALAFRDRVPDPIASHWGFAGAPDDSMPVATMLIFVLGGWLAVAVGAVVVGARGWQRRQSRAATGAILGAGAVFFAGLALLTVWANVDVAEWRQARSLNWQVLPVLGAAGLAGGLGWFVGNRGPDVESEQDLDPGTELILKPGERTVWLSSATSPVLYALGGLVVLVGAVISILQEWQVALVPLLVGVAILATSSARVQIDERGVRTAFGPQRWPVRCIRLSRITGARVETRRPTQAGGWGYRLTPRFTAIMLRGGDCLVLRLTSGRDFIISVDHAERGAELVNALITERSAL